MGYLKTVHLPDQPQFKSFVMGCHHYCPAPLSQELQTFASSRPSSLLFAATISFIEDGTYYIDNVDVVVYD
ncbi:MAG: hypothetical protein R2764_13635 [Bacteroidales bacterium]